MDNIALKKFNINQLNDIKTYYNISSIILNSLEKEFIAYVLGYKDQITIRVFGYQSKEYYFHLVVHDIQGFINDIQKIMDSKIVAVIFQINGFKDDKFGNIVEFCKVLKDKLDDRKNDETKILYEFVSNFEFLITKMLVTSDANVKVGEYIMVLLIHSIYFEIVELKYTENGYEIIRNEKIGNVEIQESPEFRAKLFGKNNHQKILISCEETDEQILKTLQNIFKAESKEVIVRNDIHNFSYICPALIEKTKWILDNKYTKFHVLPTTARVYYVGYYCGLEYGLLRIERCTALPYEKTFTVSKRCYDHFYGYIDPETQNLVRLHTFTLKEEAHEYEFTFKIDIYNFPNFEIQGKIVEQIINFPSLCDRAFGGDDEDVKDIPVIGFYDDYSFICIWDKLEGGYKFMENWGGQWGKSMHISFDKEKDQYGKAAEEILGKTGKFVVHDLINIMSFYHFPQALEAMNCIGFEIRSNDENPVLLEFNTFDGTKKSATPQFLLAMLLRQHFKAIKKTNGGIKPKNVAFCLLDDLLPDQVEGAEQYLDRACELLEIESNYFVDWH